MVLRRISELHSYEAQEAMRNPRSRGAAKRKWSVLLLNEAVRVADEVGVEEAARVTGVSANAVRRHRRAMKIAAGEKVRAYPAKYPVEVKHKVIEQALFHLKAAPMGIQACFELACQAHGLPKKAGKAILEQYRMGTIPNN